MLYPLFLLSLLVERHPLLWRAILIPAISFAAVSIFRRIVNVPRPYEKFGLAPVLAKDTHGKSFPSRHVFSIYIIAMTILPVYPYLGITLLVLGLTLPSSVSSAAYTNPGRDRRCPHQGLSAACCIICDHAFVFLITLSLVNSSRSFSSRYSPYLFRKLLISRYRDIGEGVCALLCLFDIVGKPVSRILHLR